ncbi:PAS domain S-box protein [Limnobacter humi]|uniref:histidine kinase n=1 Tax=Limnobacter humi TaxID=1778671 RepID=A0ABT1WHY3_9BURK|nr:PAS domain S-box protein [Limnobacter humi]
MRLIDQPRTSPLVWATPLVGMILFILAMGAFFYNLYAEDQSQAQLRVTRDVENARNNIRSRLLATQDRVTQIARGVEHRLKGGPDTFKTAANALLAEYPEINSVMVIDLERRVTQVALPPLRSSDTIHPLYQTVEDAESYWAFNTARETRLPVFSRPFLAESNAVYMEIHSPISEDGEFKGTVVATIPLNDLLADAFPDTFIKLYSVSIVDGGGNPIASNVSRSVDNAKLSHEVPLEPPGHGLKLRAVLYKTSSELFSNMLAWTVLGLSVVIIWSFGLLFRHAKLRSRAEKRLLDETKFRRAMENSVMTGMRAIDLQGRITYVNPAFCKMTGYTETELVGMTPPFPYWPENSQEQRRHLELILTGKAPTKGIEVQVRRRDNTVFDARMYVSPLVDSEGNQSGWMTSMTDITEPRRIRDELAAAHRRFVRILEELDAAVSIRSAESAEDEFIFVNKLHREWFAKAYPPKYPKSGRIKQPSFEPFEWFNPVSTRWYEVRRRSISWVDGATVVMQVATDITSRKEAENMTRQQQEKLQFTSRLVTLGELASSLAHEINQPLAAISNYNMGSVNRLKSGRVSPEELLPVLEKVNVQAQRAGDVIRRIREFVKQQEPKRSPCLLSKIVDDAIGFSQLEATHRGARIECALPDPNIQVLADPILIEQVLMNLIKNGLEAMEHLSKDERVIEIDVHAAQNPVRVEVRDHGTGVPEDIRQRLFESFFTTKSEGMGMGLNICRTIIEYHQGQLWVEPAPGRGSVFKFTLPLAIQTDALSHLEHVTEKP